MKKKLLQIFEKNKSSIFLVILVGFLIYFLLPSWETIQQSIEEIKGAKLDWVLVAVVLFFGTIPLNAAQLRVVSDIKVKFWLTYKVQMAYLFIGKILPSSISAFVVNSFYLHAIGHTPSQTASVVAIKAVSSSVAFMILGIIAIFLGLSNLGNLGLSSDISAQVNINFKALLLILIIGGVSIFWLLLKVEKAREFLNKTVGNFWGQFKEYRKRPWDVIWAVVYSLILTTMQILTLFACAYALGMEITFTQIFVIFTLGNTATMLVPTPGGVGAAEAGLYAGFSLMGYPASQSLAVVTLYRIITFWIPILPGFIFFANLRKDLLKDFKINKEMFKRRKKASKSQVTS